MMSVRTFMFPEDLPDYEGLEPIVSNTNDLNPRMLLSEHIPSSIYAERAPPLSRARVSFISDLVGENVTIIGGPGFTFEPDVCEELPRCDCAYEDPDLKDRPRNYKENVEELSRVITLVEKYPPPRRKHCPCVVDNKGPPWMFPPDHGCEIIPVPAIAGGPYADTEALLIYGPGSRRGTLRVRGPPVLPAHPRPEKPKLPRKWYGQIRYPDSAWYLLTAEGMAARWREFRGLRVPELPTMLTVPSIKSQAKVFLTIEFTLGGDLNGPLSDGVLSTELNHNDELRGMRMILTPPAGYQLICELLKDFELDGKCELDGAGAVITAANRLVRPGDFALCLHTTTPAKTPEPNDFVLRVETMDGIGVASSKMRGPTTILLPTKNASTPLELERPRLKWMYFVEEGPMPVALSVYCPRRVIIRLLSSLLITLPPTLVHRIFEPENIAAPSIPYDMYDLDVSDPRRVRLILIKEAYLEGLLKVSFEVSVPAKMPLGSNLWKISFLSDTKQPATETTEAQLPELVSFALPGFEIGDTPSDWVPGAAVFAPLAGLALLFS